MHRIQQQFCALFLIGIGALGAWPANTLAGQTLDARYDRFMVVHEQTRGQSTAERAMAMSVAFDNGFAAALARDPASMDSQDLAILFNAANIAHAYSIQATHLQAMQRAFGERVAMNAPIQGTAADIIKIAMVRVYRRLKEEVPAAQLILQVHDELIVETPQGSAEQVRELVRQEMESAVSLSVPLLVDAKVGKTWGEAH